MLELTSLDGALLIDKPAGLTVHATAERKTGTLVNRLLAYDPLIRNVGEPHRPGIVHRLDRDVSGVMVAVGNGGGAYTTGLTNWTASSIPSGINWNCAALVSWYSSTIT